MVSTAVESSFRTKDVSIVKRANGFLLERKRKQKHRSMNRMEKNWYIRMYKRSWRKFCSEQISAKLGLKFMTIRNNLLANISIQWSHWKRDVWVDTKLSKMEWNSSMVSTAVESSFRMKDVSIAKRDERISVGAKAKTET